MHKRWSFPPTGFRDHATTDGSLLKVSGKEFRFERAPQTESGSTVDQHVDCSIVGKVDQQLINKLIFPTINSVTNS